MIVKKIADDYRLVLRWDHVPLEPVRIVFAENDARNVSAVLIVSNDGVRIVRSMDGRDEILKADASVPIGELELLRRGSFVRVRWDGHEMWIEGATGVWVGIHMAKEAKIVIDDPSNAIASCVFSPLPWLKSMDMPVIEAGPDGSYMEQQVIAGAILEDNGMYYMYTMAGKRGEQEGSNIREIGLCKSEDLVHWEVSKEPLIRFGELNVPHDNLYPNACVRRDDGKIVLLMTVQRYPDWVGECAFLADSPEGPFVPYEGNPIIKPDITFHEHDVVRWDGPEGKYLMYLTRFEKEPGGRMGDRGVRYFSDDLLSWRKDLDRSTVFAPETADGWDAAHVRTRGLNKIGNMWYLWYEGVNYFKPPVFDNGPEGFVNSEWWDTVGLARTSDFISWEYYPLNPCVNPTGISRTRYDSRWTGWPRMIVKDGIGYLFLAVSGEKVHVALRTIPIDVLTDWTYEYRDAERLI